MEEMAGRDVRPFVLSHLGSGLQVALHFPTFGLEEHVIICEEIRALLNENANFGILFTFMVELTLNII